MKGRKWENDELEYLKANSDKLTLTEIATKLNRPPCSILFKINGLKLPKANKDTLREETILRADQKRSWTVLKSTLCWDCANAIGGCSWSKDFVPVEGWKAKETRLYATRHKEGIISYCVQECPEFIYG